MFKLVRKHGYLIKGSSHARAQHGGICEAGNRWYATISPTKEVAEKTASRLEFENETETVVNRYYPEEIPGVYWVMIREEEISQVLQYAWEIMQWVNDPERIIGSEEEENSIKEAVAEAKENLRRHEEEEEAQQEELPEPLL